MSQTPALRDAAFPWQCWRDEHEFVEYRRENAHDGFEQRAIGISHGGVSAAER